MRIIIVGASGTLGKAAVDALQQWHDIIQASRNGEAAVCSPMAKETAEKMGWGPGGVPVAEITKYYVQSLESDLNGALIGPSHSDKINFLKVERI